MIKNLENECDNPLKHPIDFMGLTPKEFSAEYKLWEENYKAGFFSELNVVYNEQSKEDKKERKFQLASALENLSTSCYLLSREMNQKVHQYKQNKMGLTAEQSAIRFRETNYYYQKMCFDLIGKDASQRSFDSVLKSINEVCRVCKNHMKNPFNEQYF